MKTTNKSLNSLTLFCLLFLVISCTSENSDVSDNSVSVSFTSGNIILNEDNNIGKDIELRTNLNVKQLGRVTISFSGDAEYGVDYITKPAAINGNINVIFPEAAEVYDFKIIPIINNNKNHDVNVIATLTNASGGIKIAGKTTHSQAITNIEIIRNVFFNFTEYNTQENVTHIKPDIKLIWEHDVLIESQIVVQVETTNAKAGIDYTIQQPIVDGKITFNVQPGDGNATVDLDILDDSEFNGDKSIKFTLVSATGGLRKGTPTEYTVNIEDDDRPAEMNFESEISQGVEAQPENAYNITSRSDFALPIEGTLKVKITTNATYGVHYKTNPETIDGISILQVNKGSSDVTIQVIAINNNQKDDDRVIELELIDATGGVIIGSGIKKHTITITDDD